MPMRCPLNLARYWLGFVGAVDGGITGALGGAVGFAFLGILVVGPAYLIQQRVRRRRGKTWRLFGAGEVAKFRPPGLGRGSRKAVSHRPDVAGLLHLNLLSQGRADGRR
jgi:hypothetical protein